MDGGFWKVINQLDIFSVQTSSEHEQHFNQCHSGRIISVKISDSSLALRDMMLKNRPGTGMLCMILEKSL